MELGVYGRKPGSVFALKGDDENSATFAVGWALSRSPTLLAALSIELTGMRINWDDTRVELQWGQAGWGFTDLEILAPPHWHIIFEAKALWELPLVEQLRKYTRRFDPDYARRALLVSLSAASQKYAAARLPETIRGIPLLHRSWGDLAATVRAAHGQAKGLNEKLWLTELDEHLKGFVSMQNSRDNNVFVVSLSSKPIREGSPYSWADVVQQDLRYFHPVGNRWPVVPPNYVGFRLRGSLLSVHHIDSYDVVNNLSELDPRWPETGEEHFVYRLGPAMTPPLEVRNGKIWPSGWYWCAIDTLLSGAFATIREARDETSRRLKVSGT